MDFSSRRNLGRLDSAPRPGGRSTADSATQAVRNGKYTSAAVGSDHLCYFVTIGLEDVGGVGAAGVQSFDPAEAIDL